jgi:CheY-like chemotaxis protein
VLIVGGPDHEPDLQQWLDVHARVSHVKTLEDAVEALRSEPFDLVISRPSELLPTPSIPLTRPAATILDSVAHGVCVVRADGEIEWANARMMTWSPELRDRVRELALQSVRAAQADDAGRSSMTARRAVVTLGTDVFEVVTTPIVDRHHRLTQVAAIVDPSSSVQGIDSREAAVERAGHELLSVDSKHFSRLEPQERLALLEQKIFRCTQEILRFDTFEVRVLDTETNKLDLVMCQGMPAEGPTCELYARAVDNGVCGYVAVSGRSHVVADVSREPRYLPGLEGARSSLTVPLWLNEKVVGVANFESVRPAAFSEQDQRLAERFGRFVAMALHSLELMASERHAAISQLGRAALEDIGAPINDILTDVDAMIDSIDDESLRERLRTVATNATRVRDTVKDLATARPCLIGARTAATRRVDPVLEGRRVLLADDEEVLRDTVRDVLTGYGCCVCTAADGATAIELIAGQAFDLVLSDIKMPIKTGYEVFAAAKQANAFTPVILTTGFGYDPNHTIIRARREGLAAVLFKPFKVDQLLSEIRAALKASAS